MNYNVGGYDRIARLAVGMVLLFVGIVGVGLGAAGALDLATESILQVTLAVGLLLVGSVLVVTGYLRQCPINDRLGIDTQYVDRI